MTIELPDDPEVSVQLVINYMYKVINRMDIHFGEGVFDPMKISSLRVAGEQVADQRESAIDHWWGVVEEIGIQDFHNRNALIARLALCLLTPSIDNSEVLRDQVYWFLDVLRMLGNDLSVANDIMQKMFSA